jgi:hypothetical protein
MLASLLFLFYHCSQQYRLEDLSEKRRRRRRRRGGGGEGEEGRFRR